MSITDAELINRLGSTEIQKIKKIFVIKEEQIKADSLPQMTEAEKMRLVWVNTNLLYKFKKCGHISSQYDKKSKPVIFDPNKDTRYLEPSGLCVQCKDERFKTNLASRTCEWQYRKRPN